MWVIIMTTIPNWDHLFPFRMKIFVEVFLMFLLLFLWGMLVTYAYLALLYLSGVSILLHPRSLKEHSQFLVLHISFTLALSLPLTLLFCFSTKDNIIAHGQTYLQRYCLSAVKQCSMSVWLYVCLYVRVCVCVCVSVHALEACIKTFVPHN